MSFIKTILTLYHRILDFLVLDLWKPTTGRVFSILFGTVRRLLVTTRLFFRERMQFRASALTYSSLLAVVPLLAILFAVAKGFGLSEILQQTIRDNLVADPAVTDTLVGFVQSYLEHTRGGVFLGFGLIMLLYTLFKLTRSIENTFNQIWQVKHARSPLRMLTDYTAVFFLLPVFIVATCGLMIYITSVTKEVVPDVLLLRPTAMTAVETIPYILVCCFFSGLYAFMPNTRVSLRSALIAGIPTGLCFLLLQYGYIHSQVWLSSYNAIYGSFAALPLFMLMCHLSWTLVLFGGTLSYVDQNIRSFYYGRDEVSMSHFDRDCLSIRLAATVCRCFARSEQPLTAAQLADKEQVHLRIAKEVLYELTQAGILIEVTENTDKNIDPVYIPACDIHTLTVPRVLSGLDRTGSTLSPGENTTDEWSDFARQRREMFDKTFEHTLLHELPIKTA